MARESARTVQRNKAARIQRNIHVEHSSHAINDSWMDYRYRSIQVPSDFRSCARKIKSSRTLCFVDLNTKWYLCEFKSREKEEGKHSRAIRRLDSRPLRECLNQLFWLRLWEDFWQTFLHCFGYDTCILVQSQDRSLRQLRAIVELEKSMLEEARRRTHLRESAGFLCDLRRFAIQSRFSRRRGISAHIWILPL